MNIVKTILSVLCLSMLFVSCKKKDKTYAEYVKAENKSIDKYIKVNNIKVVNSRPDKTEGEWIDEDGNPIYWKTNSGLYYHQVKLGDTTATAPKVSATAYIRYIGTNLYEDVIYDCSEKRAPNPQSFTITSSSSTSSTFGVGVQEAVTYMYKGGECKTIISFKIGNGENGDINGRTVSDYDNHTPMSYTIRLINVK